MGGRALRASPYPYVGHNYPNGLCDFVSCWGLKWLRVKVPGRSPPQAGSWDLQGSGHASLFLEHSGTDPRRFRSLLTGKDGQRSTELASSPGRQSLSTRGIQDPLLAEPPLPPGKPGECALIIRDWLGMLCTCVDPGPGPPQPPFPCRQPRATSSLQGQHLRPSSPNHILNFVMASELGSQAEFALPGGKGRSGFPNGPDVVSCYRPDPGVGGWGPRGQHLPGGLFHSTALLHGELALLFPG